VECLKDISPQSNTPRRGDSVGKQIAEIRSPRPSGGRRDRHRSRQSGLQLGPCTLHVGGLKGIERFLDEVADGADSLTLNVHVGARGFMSALSDSRLFPCTCAAQCLTFPDRRAGLGGFKSCPWLSSVFTSTVANAAATAPSRMGRR